MPATATASEAIDRAGNIGVLRYGTTFKAALVQETASTALTYAGTWSLSTSTAYSAGHSKNSATALDSASYAFTGQGIAWVSSKSVVRGGARVYIDGLLVQSVSLYARRPTTRQVVFATRFAVNGVHTIRIVVIGTAGHPRVDLDAFVVTH